MDQKTPSPNKLLVSIQFWEGDKKQALRLAKLIADIEPEFREDVDIMFAARYDCGHDRGTTDHVARKFNVSQYTCDRRASGYPMGSNELWWGQVCHFASLRAANKFPYNGVMFLEADSAPISPDWLSQLHRLAVDSQAIGFSGHYIADHALPHINGNCLITPEVLPALWRVGGSDPTLGWDLAVARSLKKWGYQDTPLIRSEWCKQTITESEILAHRGNGTVFLHGVKDDSLHTLVRKLLIPSVQPLLSLAS